jgi:hypothetical protein
LLLLGLLFVYNVSFQNIIVAELICRASKHLFKVYMQGVDQMSLSSAISHFLNCFLGSLAAPHASVTAEEVGTGGGGYILHVNVVTVID